MLVALAARHALLVVRWDLTSAYLQGELQPGEEVYTHVPPGQPEFDDAGRPLRCRVVKPIYGLVQAGRRFQRTLFPWIVAQGFEQSSTDPCVFVWKGDEHLYVGVYVDDIMVVHSDGEAPAFHEFKRAFFARWQAEDEGEMADLLNVHIRRGDGCITLHQEPYIRGMVRRFAPDGFPSDLPRTSTPSDAHLAQTVADAQAADITTDAALTNRFQTLVGALLYAATHTRPDIAYAVGMLCRVMSRSTPALYAYAMVVLRYLDRNAAIGLRYTSVPTTLEGYFDANWDVLRSTTGWLVTWQSAVIAYGSKSQKGVATSSAHAEIVAASEAAKDVVHHRTKFAEFKHPPLSATLLYGDNQAANNLAYNPELHERTKHIARRHFYIREVVEEGQIVVPYVRTIDNLADFFTKHQTPKVFFAMRAKIMNIP